eukprot:gene41171-50963_t
MSIQVLIFGIHLARSTRGKPCAPPQLVRSRSLLEIFMTDLFDNPMGLCGFEFVEFASPVAGMLEPLFEMMGFSL